MNGLKNPKGANSGPIAILGGSAEARELACRLGDHGRLWLAEQDRVTGICASPREDFGHMLKGCRALVIAPHPCDTASVQMATRVAMSMQVPTVSLIRPTWHPGRRDHWVILRDAKDAAANIPKGSRVLVTLGRPALSELRALRHVTAFVRQLNKHDTPFPMRVGRYLFGTPPFTVASEIALMRKFRIDAVLTRNAGGPGGWPKIAAARELDLPVYMVDRPRIAGRAAVGTVDEALIWLETRS